MYILLIPERIFCSTADETFWWLRGKTGIKTWSIDYFLRSITKHLDDSDVYVSPVYWIIVAKSSYMHHYSFNFLCYSFTDLSGERRPCKADLSCCGILRWLPCQSASSALCAFKKQQPKTNQMTLFFFTNQNLSNTASFLKWLLLPIPMTKAVSTKQNCLSKLLPFLQTSLAFQIICSDKHQFSMWNFPY